MIIEKLIKDLINLSYETGYIAGAIEHTETPEDDPIREQQKELIKSRNDTKEALLLALNI
jgi:hypothetical protein